MHRIERENTSFLSLSSCCLDYVSGSTTTVVVADFSTTHSGPASRVTWAIIPKIFHATLLTV